MEFKFSTGQLLEFIHRNWFKLAVVALCLYIYLGKDFRFNLQVQVPETTGRPAVAAPKEKMTDASAFSAHVDKLEVPFIGSSQPLGRNLMSELVKISEGEKHAYLQRFAKVAVQEQEKYGIPASVILATAFYQSLAGKRELTQKTENHFGLTCDSGWRSACKSVQGKSYRKYESAWFSFRDFSQYAERHFSNLKGSAYASWAMGMQKANFSEGDEAFAKNIIEIIKGYRLQELDQP